MFLVAFVVAGLCELAQKGGGGWGSVMPSFFELVVVGSLSALFGALESDIQCGTQKSCDK